MYINPVRTEWDRVKRDWTLRERGLDFASVDAAEWDAALTEPDNRASYGEDRFVSLVPIHGRLCVVAWCMRGEAFRVISLRVVDCASRKRASARPNAKERKRYDQA